MAGDPVRLHDETTWPAVTDQTTLSLTAANGQQTTLKVWRWSNLLMRGTRLHRMHHCPFDLVGIQPVDPTFRR